MDANTTLDSVSKLQKIPYRQMIEKFDQRSRRILQVFKHEVKQIVVVYECEFYLL